MKLEIIEDGRKLDELGHKLKKIPQLAFDTETTGLEFWRNKIFMLSFSDGETAWVVPCEKFPYARVRKVVSYALSGPWRHIVGHNVKFDMHHVKSTYGLEVTAQIHDTKVMAHLLDENRNNSLKELMRTDLYMNTYEETGILTWLKEHFKKKSDYRYDKVPYELMTPYSGMDSYGTFKLFEHYSPYIERHFRSLYENEMKVLRILYKMEQNGLPIDVEYFKKLRHEYEEKIQSHEQSLIIQTGDKNFNVRSNDQLGKYIEGKLGVTIPELSEKTGKPKVSSDVLKLLNHPFVGKVLQYRELNKLLSTYINPFIELNDNGVIHGSYSIARTDTGRFSCSRPNLQNIPKNEKLRKGFIVNENEEMWFWDQSQIEMVGFAHYSRESQLMEAFIKGRDVYSETASKVLQTSTVSKSDRQIFKAMNLAMIYGVGAKKLYQYLNMSLDEKVSQKQAGAIRQQYLDTFPGIKEFTRKVMDTVKENRAPFGNYVKNEFGRVRRIDPAKAYTGVNHLIQGFAADLMKVAMVEIERKLQPNWKQQIHDAIRLDLPLDKAQKREYIEEVTQIITGVYQLRVPIRATVEHSNTNWAEVEPYELSQTHVS